MTIEECKNRFTRELSGLYDVQETAELYYIAVAEVLQLTRMEVLLRHGDWISNEQDDQLNVILNQLKAGAPVQHIIKKSWFYGLLFKVTNKVLIPRPETEELVNLIIKAEESTSRQPLRLLDIGTGSGCISIALKVNLPALAVTAMDISDEAIEIARSNALGNSAAIRFLLADIRSYQSTDRYEIIVSNPPYVMDSERESMLPNVLEHEPHLALFVPDSDPLLFYVAIADFARHHLIPMGRLYLEINERLGKEMVEMLTSKGFTEVVLRKDMQGKDRMISCVCPDQVLG